jgi:hypothetical protein
MGARPKIEAMLTTTPPLPPLSFPKYWNPNKVPLTTAFWNNQTLFITAHTPEKYLLSACDGQLNTSPSVDEIPGDHLWLTVNGSATDKILHLSETENNFEVQSVAVFSCILLIN